MMNNKQIREYMVKISGLVFDVNTKTNHDVFLDFSGHVNQLAFNYHKNGWKRDADAAFSMSTYINDGVDSEENLKKMIKKLKLLLADATCNLEDVATETK